METQESHLRLASGQLFFPLSCIVGVEVIVGVPNAGAQCIFLGGYQRTEESMAKL